MVKRFIHELTLIIGVVLAVGGVVLAYGRQTYASNTDVEVMKQKQNDQYVEIIKRLDSIDRHLEHLEQK